MTSLAQPTIAVTTKAASLSITPLTEADATAEYALASMCRPELAHSQWQTFLQAWRSAHDSRGILSARNQRGGVLGFVPWWRQPDLEQGEILWAGPFVVRELGVRPLVRESLIQALSEMSCQMGIGLKLAHED